jgi:hypothetical protein
MPHDPDLIRRVGSYVGNQREGTKATSKSETRFWHFADLHLGEHEECSEGPCHACIAERVLAALVRELRATPEPPHLILFAGDIFNLPKEATSGKRTWDEQRIADSLSRPPSPSDPFWPQPGNGAWQLSA